MGYSIGTVRRWDAGALATAGTEISTRRATAEEARGVLVDGRDALDADWDGLAAEAVLAAAEAERIHVTRLVDGIDDLTTVVANAETALGPAVQGVADRIAGAEAAGLVVGEDSVGPAPGRRDIEQSTVDEHAEAISRAIDTVASLDRHYGDEIDAIATRLHAAIPPAVDRGVIPGPDDPWPGRAVDAMTSAMTYGFPNLADELDPDTRGRHTLNPAPDDFGRATATGLRSLGRLAGPLGTGLTLYDGVNGYVKGETTAVEAAAETTGALAGGAAGGMALGAGLGMLVGPAGAILGAGIGAAVGSYLGQKGMDEAHEAMSQHLADAEGDATNEY